MNRFTKTMGCGLLAVALGATTLAGCGDAVDGTKTVATCNGEEVKLGVASFLVRYSQAQMETYYGGMLGKNMWDTKPDDTKSETLGDNTKSNMMTQLEEMLLMRQHAKDYDVSISEDEQKKIEESAKAFIDANKEETLKEIGASQKDVAEALELFTIQSKMRGPMTKDVDTNVSDEEAAQSKVTLVRVSTVGTEKDESGKTKELTGEEKEKKKDQAQQVLDKVLASEDPAAADMDVIAKEVDENLSASPSNYGKDDESLDKAIITAADGLQDGQLASQVIEGENAYYVVRLDKKFDQESTDTKKESIVNTRKEEAYQAKLDEWKKDAEFSIEKGVWKKIKVTDSHSFVFKQEAANPEDTQSTDGSTGTDGTAPADTGTTDTGNTQDSGTTDNSGNGEADQPAAE